jgi:hypothetical protein
MEDLQKFISDEVDRLVEKASEEYCKETPVDEMGFTQRASCKAQGYIERSDGEKRKSDKYEGQINEDEEVTFGAGPENFTIMKRGGEILLKKEGNRSVFMALTENEALQLSGVLERMARS